MWFLYVICPVNNILCPCMFHSLPPTGFGPRLVVNPDNLDLLPETAARGQERPLKVTLLPGHRGLDADMGSLGKQMVLVRGQPILGCVFGMHVRACAK